MMIKAFTLFILTEEGKELIRTNDLEIAMNELRQINFYQHSGRFRNLNLECIFNPDLNMVFKDQCIEIKLAEIKPNPVHIEEKKHIEEVRMSVEEKGLIVPLSVDLDNNLLDGHHRYRALKALGVETVLVLKKSREWYKTMEEEVRNDDRYIKSMRNL